MRRHAGAPLAESSFGRGNGLPLGLVLVLALGALCLMAGTARGAEVHAFAPPPFGAPGSGPGQLALSESSGVAVNPSSGDVYVADSGNQRVSQFAADGSFIRTFGTFSQPNFIAIDNANGDVYVVDSTTNNPTVSKFTASGAPVSGWGSGGKIAGTAVPGKKFGEIAGVAVAPGGNLLVLGYLEVEDAKPIFEFSPAGAFLKRFDLQFQNAPAGIAVDSSGAVYKVRGAGSVAKFSPTGELLSEEVDPGTASGLAVDRATDDLYVAHSDHVSRYAANGAPLEPSIGFGAGLTAAAGLAVDQSTGALYVADANAEQITRFAFENVELPVATIDPVASPSPPTPHLTGAVDPEGHPATCRFEYVTQAQFEAEGFSGAQSTPCAADPGSGTSPVAVEADLLGIPGATAYHVRLAATNAAGASFSAEPNPSFENEAVAPPAVTIGAPGGLTGHEAQLSAQVSPNAPGPAPQDPAYDTHWRFECEPACQGLQGGTVAGDDSAHTVSEAATALQPNTPYTVTVIAESVGGRVEDSTTFESPALAPGVATSYNTPEPEGKARLVGYVNPFNTAVTACAFEYGPTAAYGSQAPCEGDPGAGGEPVEVTAHLAGLTPGATYHYRVTVASAAGPNASSDATFTAAEDPASVTCPNPSALGAGRLPECRAWEMVSPPDKNGADVMQVSGRTRMAADGSAANFASLIPFGDASGAGLASDFLAVRGPEGWSTHGIAPPQPPTTEQAIFEGLEPRYRGEFSADLGRGVFFAWRPLDQSDPNVFNAANIYLRDDLRSPGPGHYELLSRCPLCAASSGPLPGSSLDRNRMPQFIGASADFGHVVFESRLNLAAGAVGEGAKLYEYAGGQVRLAGVLPNGDIPAEAGAGPGPTSGAKTLPQHTVSADGAKVFFTADGSLYMRLNGSETVQLNLPEPGAPAEAQQPARFWDASVDGSRVFFTSGQRLTADATRPGERKLYMYDTSRPGSEPDNLTLVGRREVFSVYGASADGSTVYFVAGDQLVAEAPGIPSTIGMFAWHEGTLRYLADMQGEEGESRVSPGGALSFRSEAPVGPTGYDHGSCPGTVSGFCREYYLYDPNSEALQCASCSPLGTPEGISMDIAPIAGAGGASAAAHRNRALASDGSRLFFSTSDRLVPEDLNGRDDAYAFDARTATASLVSSGTDESPSYTLENDADGSDVLFVTRERLSGWDIDTNYDLYDARVGGGLPEPAPVPAACQGESCRPAAAAPPAARGGGSAAFSGAGNPRCKKPKKPQKKHGKKHRRAAHKQKRCAGKTGRAGR